MVANCYEVGGFSGDFFYIFDFYSCFFSIKAVLVFQSGSVPYSLYLSIGKGERLVETVIGLVASPALNTAQLAKAQGKIDT